MPTSLDLNTAAAKIYDWRWWSLLPPFWYQFFIDSSDDVKITANFRINDTEVKFDLPSYNLKESKEAPFCTNPKTKDENCKSSYTISGISPSPAAKLQMTVTETDPTEIKAIGDTFEDIAKKVRQQALDKLGEEAKNF